MKIEHIERGMIMLSQTQKEYLMDLIEKGEKIPEDFKYLLFPSSQFEYELTYAGKMRKEDILAHEDGTFPVPIQVERVYNGEAYESYDDDWKNMIVFGDNLQFLKTIYENKDPVIKDKVKNKVKLIYIDPPFATEDEFRSTLGAKAYNDKRKGAEFLEFLRRRLILAREILANDGSIFVHMDQKMGHYVKVIMDEVFGKNNFRNEIIWHYDIGTAPKNDFKRKHDNIFRYTKSSSYFYEPIIIPPKNIDRYNKVGEDGRKYMIRGDTGVVVYADEGQPEDDVWTFYKTDRLRNLNSMSNERRSVNYPTQKPEALIERIIRSSTKEGDIVLDFFAGSGTTMSVAEKLNRRWIVCDTGKLSYFTMQRRLLQIESSNALDDSGEKHRRKPRAFLTATLGIYDLEKTLTLEWEKYVEFVSGLFEVDIKKQAINGIEFDGVKRGFPVKIFDYLNFKEAAIDDYYLNNLSTSLSGRGIGRVYIIAPATRVNFIADYEEINDIRYYFLRVPYEMIRELHRKPFQKLRQPKSKNEINSIEEMIGFQFIFPPEVKSNIIKEGNNIYLQIKEFKNQYLYDDKGEEYDNFETLSAIYIDYDFDGDTFEMDAAFFADEVIPRIRGRQEYDKEELEKNGVIIELPKEEVGDKVMVVYSDIYGNDFKEVLEIEGG